MDKIFLNHLHYLLCIRHHQNAQRLWNLRYQPVHKHVGDCPFNLSVCSCAVKSGALSNTVWVPDPVFLKVTPCGLTCKSVIVLLVSVASIVNSALLITKITASSTVPLIIVLFDYQYRVPAEVTIATVSPILWRDELNKSTCTVLCI